MSQRTPLLEGQTSQAPEREDSTSSWEEDSTAPQMVTILGQLYVHRGGWKYTLARPLTEQEMGRVREWS